MEIVYYIVRDIMRTKRCTKLVNPLQLIDTVVYLTQDEPTNITVVKIATKVSMYVVKYFY